MYNVRIFIKGCNSHSTFEDLYPKPKKKKKMHLKQKTSIKFLNLNPTCSILYNMTKIKVYNTFLS